MPPRPLARPLHRPFAPLRQAQGGAAADAGGGGGNPAAGMWWEGMDLWLDFANNYGQNAGAVTTPTALVTDTHAQTIYAPDTTGLYTPFTANVLTRTDLGLQTVPTRTQLLTQPNDYSSAAWTQTAVTPTAGQPDSLGGTSAYLVTESSSGALIRTTATITVVAASTYVVSVEIARSNTNWIRILIGSTTGFADSVRVWVNLATGAIGTHNDNGTGYGYVSSTIASEINGLYRVSIVCTAPTTALAVGICSASSDGSTTRADIGGGAGIGSAYIIGNSDVTLGAFAVPPIRTGSATVNGNQQVISGLGTQLAVGVAGIVQISRPVVTAVGDLLWFSDGTTNNRIFFDAAAGNLRILVYAGAALQGALIIAPDVVGVTTIAFAVGTNFLDARKVGAADPGADTVVTYPSGLDNATLGGRGYDTLTNTYQYARKLALKFGPQDASTFDAMYQRAVLAAAA